MGSITDLTKAYEMKESKKILEFKEKSSKVFETKIKPISNYAKALHWALNKRNSNKFAISIAMQYRRGFKLTEKQKQCLIDAYLKNSEKGREFQEGDIAGLKKLIKGKL